MSNASNAGRHARRDDMKIHENPDQKGTPNFFKWRNGWHAEDEAIQALEPKKAFKTWTEGVG